MIAVIVYHFNDKILSGGYLGVDVFFISGFVIISLYKRKPKILMNSFSFFERRIKRLIPSLCIYGLVTALSYVFLIMNQQHQ